MLIVSTMSHKQGNNESIVTAKAGVYYHKGGMHANNVNLYKWAIGVMWFRYYVIMCKYLLQMILNTLGAYIQVITFFI